MVVKTLSLVAMGLVVVLVLAWRRPDTIRIRRTQDIQAPPEKVFALVEDFRNWHFWAPQDVDDAFMQRTFSGAERGVGAISDWHSRGGAGRGRMEIIEAVAPLRVTVKVDFVQPFEAHNINEFEFTAVADHTTVTWTMEGSNPFLAKLMSVFISMDRMMGAHFEAGLNNLKSLAEQPAGP